MRSKQSCGECTRRKIKCDRGSPCSNCKKFKAYCFYVAKEVKLDYELTELANGTLTENNFNFNLITVNENGRGDKIDLNGLSRYRFNKYLKLERRLASLNYTLNKLVNQSFVDPKIEMLMNGFDFELYESTMGMKLIKKALKTKMNYKLFNPSQSENMNELISELVSMYFEYCTICIVSIRTITSCYERNGLNSYLVNCICACMMPQYLALRGRSEGLELQDNIFYLRALFLFKSNSTTQIEIAWGTPALLLLELQYGSLFNAFVHLGKLTASCFEMKLHCLDEHHSQSPILDMDTEYIETRNAWWGCLSAEAVASLLFLRPVNLVANAKQTQIPNPHLNFSPSPFHQFDESYVHPYPHPHPYNLVDTSYQTDSQLNSMAKLTSLAVYVGHAFNSYLKLCTNIPEQMQVYQNFKFKFFTLLDSTEDHFSLQKYLENVQSNPNFHATTAQLTACITYHGMKVICKIVESKLDKEFNQLDVSSENLIEAKFYSNQLLQFIKITLQLPNYPPPEVDLTPYYLSSQLIPIVLLQLTKAFIPVKSGEDLNSLQLIASIIQKYSILSQHYSIYFEWCQHIIKHNGYFSLSKIAKNNNDLVIGLLRESW